MINHFLSKIGVKHYKKDFLYMILFGGLSLIFAGIKFYIPGYEEIVSNFREIPLLISIFYIRNPLYIIGLSLITTIYTSSGIPYTLNFSVHLVSLLSSWIIYSYLKVYFKSIVSKSTAWTLISILYFILFLIPTYIIVRNILDNPPELHFWESYISVFESLKIEVVTTVLVTGLYLMQLEIRGALQEHKNNLEEIVNNRTEELALANKTLTYLNENLDDLVKNRSIKIEEQLNLLVRYAHMNSHEVRAPLARLLGLLYIIEKGDETDDKADLHKQLNEAAAELDDVVKRMNRLLEREIFTSNK